MKKTKNYSLNKPEESDQINIEDINYNTEEIDKLIKAIEEGLKDKKIPDEIDKLLKSLSSTIESHKSNGNIHHAIFSGTTDPDPSLGGDGDLYFKYE